MQKLTFCIFLLLCGSEMLLSQEYSQVIKGRVIDLNTKAPLIGANIVLLDSTRQRGTITDEDGYFIISNVPIGRQNIQVGYIGYYTNTITNLYVGSGKELTVSIELEEKVLEAKASAYPIPTTLALCQPEEEP